MKSNIQARNAWIRRQHTHCRPQVMRSQEPCLSRQEVCIAIKEHWESVWQRAKNISSFSQEEQWNFLQEDLPGPFANSVSDRPSLQHVVQVASALKGAAGVDQWHAELKQRAQAFTF